MKNMEGMRGKLRVQGGHIEREVSHEEDIGAGESGTGNISHHDGGQRRRESVKGDEKREVKVCVERAENQGGGKKSRRGKMGIVLQE